MENVWDKLKALKGRSWAEAKDILNKIKDTGNCLEEIVISYKINAETLSEEDRDIYGVYPKDEPFYLERCKICSRLLKPSVLSNHYDIHHKRNTSTTRKTSSFVSPNKKKHSRKGNKSTSEDDSESVISSETPSPALDLQDNSSSNLDSSAKEDTIVDIISVEEIPSEDSKPPTPGPQDLYEEFAVPYTEEIPTTFSSTLETSDNSKAFPNSKNVLKLKITANKDLSQKTQNTTSLLEAHLLANTKYNTSSGYTGSDLKFKNSSYKFNVTSFNKNDIQNASKGNEQTGPKLEEQEEKSSDTWKISNYGQSHATSVGSSKLKTDTKISIPISAVPQNVKIIGNFKKANAAKVTSLLKNSSLKMALNAADSGDSSNASSFCVSAAAAASPPVVATVVEQPMPDIPIKIPEKTFGKSKKSKRSKGKNRAAKDVEYDPNKHCGVLIDENRRCLRSLTCKTHLISLRRAVEGRSKKFDKLLADHRASKELLKEQERSQNLNLSEPIISLPILTADSLSGNTIQITTANNESEIIKIRVPNAITNPEIAQHTNNSSNNVPQIDNNTQPKLVETEKPFKKLPVNKPANVFAAKSSNIISKATTNAANLGVKSQLYENDVKVSFVCSDMLYKVGGLLYMDRSRQAIRKCMDPLVSKEAAALKNPTVRPRHHVNRKITDFLQPVKNTVNHPLTKLSVFKEENAENLSDGTATTRSEKLRALKTEIKLKANDELERMKSILANSSKILNSLSLDENKLQRLKSTRRLKRRAGAAVGAGGEENGNAAMAKKVKQENVVADENYDLSSFLTFDKGNHRMDTDSGMENFAFNGGAAGFRGGGVSADQGADGQENLPNISNMMDNISYNVFLNNENGGAENFNENDTVQLLQTFKELENEICNTVVTAGNMQNLYNSSRGGAGTAPLAVSSGSGNNAFIDYLNQNVVANNAAQFKENCENEFKVIDNNMPNFDENMAKNYSLLEEYCKSIATDELFLTDKTNFEFFENGGRTGAGGSVGAEGGDSANVPKTSKGNEVIVVNENLFAAEGGDQNPETLNRETSDEGLNFETHILNTYLSSISGESNNQDNAYLNFGGRQFDMSRVESQDGQILVKCNPENMYEEILTLNKQFQDNTAVKIDQPPTSSAVYTKADNEEVLKWLF